MKPHIINPGMAREMRRAQREQTRQKKVGRIETVKSVQTGGRVLQREDGWEAYC